MKKKVRTELVRGEYGWKLIPKEGSSSLLNELYACNYEGLTEEKKCFRPDLSKSKAMDFVLSVAEDLILDLESSIRMFEVHSITDDTIEIIQNEKPDKYEINFKWSLWSEAEEVWMDNDAGDAIAQHDKLFLEMVLL